MKNRPCSAHLKQIDIVILLEVSYKRLHLKYYVQLKLGTLLHKIEIVCKMKNNSLN